MEMLKYKGFIGTVEVVHEDNTLYGKVLGIDKGTLITYEGNIVSELKEDYIEHCKEHNLPLRKSFSGLFNVRLTPELHTKVADKSAQIGISLNAFVKETLQKEVL